MILAIFREKRAPRFTPVLNDSPDEENAALNSTAGMAACTSGPGMWMRSNVLDGGKYFFSVARDFDFVPHFLHESLAVN